MNITALSILQILASIPFFFAAIFTYIHYLRTHYSHAILFMILWSSLFVWRFLLGLVDIFGSIELKTIGILCLIPAGFSIVILLDMISRNNIEPYKIMIITIISVFLIVFSQASESQIVGDRAGNSNSFITSGTFSTIAKIYALIIGTLFLGYMIRIAVYSPNPMKIISRVNLLGAFIMGGAAPLLYLIGISRTQPWLMDFLFSGGSLICALCFIYKPQLAYVLPFQANRLMIIDTKSGISLYNFVWQKTDKDFHEASIAGGIHGLSCMVNLFINRGSLSEIIFDNGVLLIKQLPTKNMACILSTTQTSRFLKQALEKFAVKLLQSTLSGGNEIDSINCEELNNLVKENFSFLPNF